MKWIKAILAVLLTVLVIYGLNRTYGVVPALGPFLSPYEGFWRSGSDDDFASEELTLDGLKAPVQIRFDSLRIPHIFAQNDHDLYYAQGYLTAKDRLWQMEFMTHAAAGRLSEIIGDRTLEMDRYQRRMGMMTSARKSLARMMADPQSRAVIEAYCAGVNAYIGQLAPHEYPFEYKLLHYAPEEWAPLKIALLLKMLAYDMTGFSDDLRMTNNLRKYGSDIIQDLFPDYPFHEEPIVPVGTRQRFKPLPIPPAPTEFMPKVAFHTLERQKPENLGSNNWAVAGARTASGYPLLASDPHLNLTLPSIWHAVQLHAPGINTYGVVIPGAPGVGIGFNEQISWGITNVGADVLDWFEIKFKDGKRQQYWHDNQWKPVRRVVEEIHIKGGQTILDTVLYTHHGPVAYLPNEKAFRSGNTPVGHALRWTAHDTQNELKTLILINRAKTFPEFRQALTTWAAPAFNFLYADTQNIGVVSNGLYPLKWQGQGKFLLDGSNPAHDWQGWIPMDQVPQVLNPNRGFVSSANQTPVSPKDYPYYLGSNFAGYERGARINQRLASMTQAAPDSFRLLQTDTYSFVPQNVLPTMLRLINQDSLSGTQKKVFQTLAAWDYRFEPDKLAPSLFEEWWQTLARAIWSDDFPPAEFKAPARDRLVQMIQQVPRSRWYDDVTTPQKETLADLVNASFKKVTDSLGVGGSQWQWGNARDSHIRHLAQLPGFGHQLFAGGSANSINALNGSHGPSWRMVVQLGPQVQAWGVYPGGQSGNPASRFYDNLLNDWQNGKLHRLLFLRSANDQPAATSVHWTLKKN
ncbi:penicillin acylase family protein [Rufibacter latericius]|uniref:Penicillin acylase family protein n=1 Tax=Rufibacter latericius TaxID=2487040 RepID=A0A3M9MDI4_9BACT|nr:penicillin acylase family protein [Rufibacter latericius]RNI23606.1 penicillin acylase family protein [Rufibacter latericius]